MQIKIKKTKKKRGKKLWHAEILILQKQILLN